MSMMNEHILKKISFCFILFVLLICFIGCDISRSKDTRVIRIIDKISEQHIIQSPLKNIIEDFNPVEEDITGKWVLLSDLSNKKQEIWGTSSRYPILGNHEAEIPEGMRLLNDGKEVAYLSGKIKQKVGWRWIGTSESLDLRAFSGFDNTKRGIILDEENGFQFKKLLPKGTLILDLYLVNSDWKNRQPKLTVTFNGGDAEELVISRKKWFRIRKKLDLGNYTISLQFSDSDKQNGSVSPIVLGQVKMTGTSDILLLTRPSQKDTKEPQGEFLFRYHTHVGLPDQKIPAVHPYLRYLYNFRNKFPLFDEGSETTPLAVKKKIKFFGEYSFNCLAAPPESEFQLDMNIPQTGNSFLEFRYGILNESKNRDSHQSIRFRVVLSRKDSDNEETLFNKTIDQSTTKDLTKERIDLADYSGSKVQLSFLTDLPYPDDENNNMPPVVPVWINPLIYRTPETARPNIILISLDTVRPDHLGCYGYEKNTSPTIDQFAADSVLFKDVYSTASWTLPAHVSLLTSLDCRNHQVYFPLQKMGPEISTFADLLRNEAFFCSAFTGGGYLSETYGFSKGFDSYQEIRLHGDEAIRYDEAERLAQQAVEWLGQNQDKNFFLFLHTYQPHDPYANLSPIGKTFLDKNAEWTQVKMGPLLDERGGRFVAQFSEEEKRNIVALYDGDLKYTDASFVKPVLEKLKDLGLYDNSFIIITSDHGEEFFDHQAWLHDHSLYNEGIKIPLIIKFPDGEHKGNQVGDSACITDILPTVLDYLGIKTRKIQFDGTSLLPFIKGKEKTQRNLVFDLALREFDLAPSLISIKKDNFKLLLNKRISSPYIGRVVRNFDGSQIELYDLEKDPLETKNLAANIAYRDLCFEMLDFIDRLYEQADLATTKRDEVTLDQSLRERLKALGYIK